MFVFLFVFFRFPKDPNLCSHLYALCFIAQSLFDHDHQMEAKRCTQVCPHLSVFQIAALGVNENAIDNDMESILIGMNIPNRFALFTMIFKWCFFIIKSCCLRCYFFILYFISFLELVDRTVYHLSNDRFVQQIQVNLVRSDAAVSLICSAE